MIDLDLVELKNCPLGFLNDNLYIQLTMSNQVITALGSATTTPVGSEPNQLQVNSISLTLY